MSAVAQKEGDTQKSGDQLLNDMKVMFYKVQSANKEGSPISRRTLEDYMTFEGEKGKWKHDEKRFDAAFKALMEGGYVKEKSETVKTGMFKSEHTLEAVKEPGKAEKAEKPSMKKDIDELRRSGYRSPGAEL
jgi:hypothetical protein